MGQKPEVVTLIRRGISWTQEVVVGSGATLYVEYDHVVSTSTHDEEDSVRGVRWFPEIDVAGVTIDEDVYTGGLVDLYAEKSDLERALQALAEREPVLVDPGDWILTWQNGDRWVVHDAFVRGNFYVPPLAYRLSEVSLGAE